MRSHRQIVEWLPANRRRTPGSWERSRVSDIDSPFFTDPPEPTAPEGFSFPQAWARSNSFRREPDMGDPDPGACAKACARSAGPVGGNEAQAGYRWQGERTKRSLSGAPYSRAPRQNLFFAFCRVLRLMKRWW